MDTEKPETDWPEAAGPRHKAIGNVKAIKKFFESDGGRTVKMAEMKALSTEDRVELGALCREALLSQEATAA